MRYTFHAPSSTGAGRPASETILFRRSDPSEVILVDLFSLRRRAARCAGDSSEGIAPVALESDMTAAKGSQIAIAVYCAIAVCCDIAVCCAIAVY